MGDLLQCPDMKLGRVTIPAFSLRPRDLLGFCWPFPVGTREECDWVDLLEGTHAHPGVQLPDEKIIFADPYFLNCQPPQLNFLFPLTVKKAVRRLFDLGDRETSRLLYSLGISRRMRWSQLDRTEQTLVALDAAGLRSRFLVTNRLRGLDPRGQRRLFAAVQRKVEQGWGIIYWQGPILTGLDGTVVCRGSSINYDEPDINRTTEAVDVQLLYQGITHPLPSAIGPRGLFAGP
ncbi:Hypothetical protein PBC10988_26560 [Planctomycetales bacterium 10988]|nr:Hypothetical protein PBC10988_26560 [Planctomycetales bacterium 10988]